MENMKNRIKQIKINYSTIKDLLLQFKNTQNISKKKKSHLKPLL